MPLPSPRRTTVEHATRGCHDDESTRGAPKTSLVEAIELMTQNRLGALPVVDAQGDNVSEF
jgi:hypothetical protein